MIPVLVFFAAVALPADFPEPEALEPNIRLWSKVYSEWTRDQIAFHDREYMGVIYAVLDLTEPAGSDDRTEGARKGGTPDRQELIRRKQSEIENALGKLLKLQQENKLNEESLDRLDDTTIKIYRALEKEEALDALEGAVGRIRRQFGLADRFYEGLKRYDIYRDAVVRPFIDRGLPEELLALAFVESLFSPTPVSHAGAGGMFQFMPATGREYGLQRGPNWDQRRDPVLAADAAARMLRRNYERLGNWPLALTGYNHGPNGVARGVVAVDSRDLMDLIEHYKSPTWGFASKNFYAQFLAVKRTLENRYEIFGEWVPFPPWETSEIVLNAPVNTADLINRGCISRKILLDNNYPLRPAAIANNNRLPRGFILRVPPGMAAGVAACIGNVRVSAPSIPVAEKKPEIIKETPKKQPPDMEPPSEVEIAMAQTGTSESSTEKKNQDSKSLSSASKPRPETPELPSLPADNEDLPLAEISETDPDHKKSLSDIEESVETDPRSEDPKNEDLPLAEISETDPDHKESLSDIEESIETDPRSEDPKQDLLETHTINMKDEGYEESADKKFSAPDQTEEIIERSEETFAYTVRAGDNLSRIARRHGISVNDILELNDIEADTILQIGRLIYLPEIQKTEKESEPE